jgi:hypothetical protein
MLLYCNYGWRAISDVTDALLRLAGLGWDAGLGLRRGRPLTLKRCGPAKPR